MSAPVSRREMLQQSGKSAGLACGAAMLAGNVMTQPATAAESTSSAEPFGYALNTSTIREAKLPLPEIVEITAKAGYHGIEPWIGEIDAFQKSGGSLDDLRKQIADLGLKVVSAIGFAQWIVDDDEQRAKGLEQAKHDMDLVLRIGGTHIAAPPAGAHAQEGLDLRAAGERYRKLLEVGEEIGVIPQVEFWGPARSLSRLSEAAYIAAESGHPKACLLTDVYHMFRGGSSFEGWKLIDGAAMVNLHINDYPGDIPREQQKDSDRVYPGDGVAPLTDIYHTLRATGYRGYLSLELFNKDYWRQDPAQVARTGLEKIRQSVLKAFS
ncbi:MAG: sugar phosphate isomerase/epimerase [Planctomycetales bacterium]|nr:sugar phosphate isomerase/epimerase [Planctomycetales bacterium]